jgi:hypothetical protein
MPKIIPIVEGDGEIDAVPNLLTRILHEQECYHFQVHQPALNASGGDNIKKPGGVEKFVRLAMLKNDCAGILVLLDSDGEFCPIEKAKELTERVRMIGTTCPVAVVIAHCEYEAWFLASIETVCAHEHLPNELIYNRDCEATRGAKKWFTDQMQGSRIYKETLHQLEFTRLLDVEKTRSNSRSFRRFCHAVEEILEASVAQQNTITPL